MVDVVGGHDEAMGLGKSDQRRGIGSTGVRAVDRRGGRRECAAVKEFGEQAQSSCSRLRFPAG